MWPFLVTIITDTLQIRRIALASTLSFFSSSGVCRNYIANYFMFNIYYFFFHFFIFCCSFLKSKNEPLLRKDDIFFLDTKLRNSSKQKILALTFRQTSVCTVCRVTCFPHQITVYSLTIIRQNNFERWKKQQSSV